jgi:hypothetical protein
MVKLVGPMMSVSAHGKWADQIIYARLGRTCYAKGYHTPANPQSAAQTLTRIAARAITQAWARLSTDQQVAWESIATAQKLSNYHAYLTANTRAWADGQPFNPSPLRESRSGSILMGADATFSGGDYAITITNTFPKGETYLIQIAKGAAADFTPNRSNTVALKPPDTGGNNYTRCNFTLETDDSPHQYLKFRIHAITGTPTPWVQEWESIFVFVP